MITDGVTFETKTWQGDFRSVLDPRRMEQLIARNAHEFAARVVFVNNVDDPAAVMRRGRRLVSSGMLTDIVLVEEYATEALAHVGLSAADLSQGYVYSVAEIVGIYLCQTPFLLHFSSDSTLPDRYEWVPSALDVLARDPRVAVANLVWNGATESVLEESRYDDGEFAYGYGFSDQMYLIRRDDFRDRIYNFDDPASSRYPTYGGPLFERRVDSWMRSTGRLRATSLAGTYVHENIRDAGWRSPVRSMAAWLRPNRPQPPRY